MPTGFVERPVSTFGFEVWVLLKKNADFSPKKDPPCKSGFSTSLCIRFLGTECLVLKLFSHFARFSVKNFPLILRNWNATLFGFQFWSLEDIWKKNHCISFENLVGVRTNIILWSCVLYRKNKVDLTESFTNASLAWSVRKAPFVCSVLTLF